MYFRIFTNIMVHVSQSNYKEESLNRLDKKEPFRLLGKV